MDKKIGLIDLLALVLSVYVLGALGISTFLTLDPELERLLEMIDNAVCIFFLGDFFLRFSQAPDKKDFMKWGWIDLISSIPSLEMFRAGRLFRIIRLFRILRAFRSTKQILEFVFRNRAQGTFGSVALVAVLLVIFASIAILQVETDPESNIKTAEDALWWAYVTITTVGYGDRYPVTTEGRIVGAVLMTAGVGLFGTFAGFVASWFLGEKKEE